MLYNSRVYSENVYHLTNKFPAPDYFSGPNNNNNLTTQCIRTWLFRSTFEEKLSNVSLSIPSLFQLTQCSPDSFAAVTNISSKAQHPLCAACPCSRFSSTKGH